jgi:hypothetical protein
MAVAVTSEVFALIYAFACPAVLKGAGLPTFSVFEWPLVSYSLALTTNEHTHEVIEGGWILPSASVMLCHLYCLCSSRSLLDDRSAGDSDIWVCVAAFIEIY